MSTAWGVLITVAVVANGVSIVFLSRAVRRLATTARRQAEANAAATPSLTIADSHEHLVRELRDDLSKLGNAQQRTKAEVRGIHRDLRRVAGVVGDCEGLAGALGVHSSPLRSEPEVAASDVLASTVAETAGTTSSSGVGEGAGGGRVEPAAPASDEQGPAAGAVRA